MQLSIRNVLALLTVIGASFASASASASVTYEEQEANYLEDPVKSANVSFLADEDGFAKHKASLFTKMTTEAQVAPIITKVRENESKDIFGYARHITADDVRAIAGNTEINGCASFADLLLPIRSLSILKEMSADCVKSVAGRAMALLKDPSKKADAILMKVHAESFTTATLSLGEKVWSSENLSLLKANVLLTPLDPKKSADLKRFKGLFDLMLKDGCSDLDAEATLPNISAEQARKITPECLMQMQNLGSFAPTEASVIKNLAADVFATTNLTLKDEVYKFMTGPQVSNFGIKLTNSPCQYFKLSKINVAYVSNVTDACFISYLEATGTPAALGKDIIKAIRREVWEAVKPDIFRDYIHQDDFEFIPHAVFFAFLTADPIYCQRFSDAYSITKLGKLPVKCFLNLSGPHQVSSMKFWKSAFPLETLRAFSAESVSRIPDGLGFLSQVSFTSQQIMAIGQDHKDSDSHPCTTLNKAELFKNAHLMKHMSDHCLAKLPIQEIVPEDGSKMPKAFVAMLPNELYMKIIAGDKSFYNTIDITDFRALVAKGICSSLKLEQFNQIKPEALAAVNAKCFIVLDATILKALGSTPAKLHAIPKETFREATKNHAQHFSYTKLKAEQFGQLSADVDPKVSVASTFTVDSFKTLPKDFWAQLSERFLSAVPPTAFSFFSSSESVVQIPAAATRGLTAEHLKAMAPEAHAGWTVDQISQLGLAVKNPEDSPIAFLLASEKTIKLSADALVAAKKRDEAAAKKLNVAEADKLEAGASSMAINGVTIAAAISAVLFLAF